MTIFLALALLGVADADVAQAKELGRDRKGQVKQKQAILKRCRLAMRLLLWYIELLQFLH